MGRYDLAVCDSTFALNQERYRLRRQAAREYVRRIVEDCAPMCVILFGSVATGTDTLDSDVDIVVVGGDLPENALDRLDRVNALKRGLGVPIDVFPYTTTEFEHMLESHHVTALEALAFGQPLHGEAYFDRLKARFNEMVRQGLRRAPGAWTMRAAKG